MLMKIPGGGGAERKLLRMLIPNLSRYLEGARKTEAGTKYKYSRRG